MSLRAPRGGDVKLAGEPRSFVGMITSVERHNESPLSRHTVIVDAVDAQLDPDRTKTSALDWDDDMLAVLRIMTTADRFAEIARMSGPNDSGGNENLVGRWVSLELVPPGKGKAPRAQVCRLEEAGFERVETFSVQDIRDFGFNPDEPKDLGAAANIENVLAARLEASSLRTRMRAVISNHRRLHLGRALARAIIDHVVVHDVGHASFTTVLSTSGVPLLHFDAGWPIGFNRKTCPPSEPVGPFARYVVLSHWDWDHLHGFHRWPEIRSAHWIVPDQPLGPAAMRVAQKLIADRRLIRISSQPETRTSIGAITLSQADPATVVGKSKKRNNSGLVLSLRLASGKTILLPADADYVAIPHALRTGPDLMTMPHHGAAVQGNIPAPATPNARAVISMGLGNCYQHPCPSNITAHAALKWDVLRTSDDPSATRGDRTLV